MPQTLRRRPLRGAHPPRAALQARAAARGWRTSGPQPVSRPTRRQAAADAASQSPAAQAQRWDLPFREPQPLRPKNATAPFLSACRAMDSACDSSSHQKTTWRGALISCSPRSLEPWDTARPPTDRLRGARLSRLTPGSVTQSPWASRQPAGAPGRRAAEPPERVLRASQREECIPARAPFRRANPPMPKHRAPRWPVQREAF